MSPKLIFLSLLTFLSLGGTKGTETEIFKCSESITQDVLDVPPALQSPLKPVEDSSNGSSTKGRHHHPYRFKLLKRSSNTVECDDDGMLEKYNLTIGIDNARLNQTVSSQLRTKKFYWSSAGTLKVTQFLWNDTIPNEHYLHPSRYCIGSISEDHIVVKVCLPNCSKPITDLVCIRKCCTPSQAVSVNLSNASQGLDCINVPKEPEWRPEISTSADKGRLLLSSSLNYLRKSLGCGNRPIKILSPSSQADIPSRGKIRILENGQGLTRKAPYGKNFLWKTREAGSFCLDRLWDLGLHGGNSEPRDENMSMVLMFCSTTEGQNYSVSTAYFVFYLISTVFALLTVTVYALLWDRQNIHGWTVAAFSFCMLLFQLAAAYTHGSILFQDTGAFKTITRLCVGVGIFFHFFYIGMFSWLTVLCFDLWRTISSLSPASTSKIHSGFDKRFGCYFCFGFGIPTLVVSISIVLELEFRDSEDVSIYRPLYGYHVCGVDRTSFLYYTTLVNMSLYSLNLIFAILVGRTLWKYKKDTKRVSQSQQSRSQSIVYLKLFVLMGVTWIFEFISLFTASADLEWYWAVLDILNILQSVGIFWMFVCKREIVDQLANKYATFSRALRYIERGRGVSIEISDTVPSSSGQGTKSSGYELKYVQGNGQSS